MSQRYAKVRSTKTSEVEYILKITVEESGDEGDEAAGDIASEWTPENGDATVVVVKTIEIGTEFEIDDVEVFRTKKAAGV
jgi:hypothetical protein